MKKQQPESGAGWRRTFFMDFQEQSGGLQTGERRRGAVNYLLTEMPNLY